jgi:type VI secretion system protein ImpC
MSQEHDNSRREESDMAREEDRRVSIHIGDEEAAPARPLPDAPFCILLVGDFGGQSREPLEQRRVWFFDRDDLDGVLGSVAPALTISSEAAVDATIRFRELEDFHPDRLFETVPVFRKLRELRKQLRDPQRSADVVRSLLGQSETPPQRLSAGNLTSGASLLDRMLDDSPGVESARAAPPRREDDLQVFLRHIVGPHLVAEINPRQAELLAATEAAIVAQMRSILHDAGFQALEASWRTAEFLARRVETGTQLRLYLVDVSRDELDADLDSADALDTQLFGLLSDAAARLPSQARWSVIAGLYAFGSEPADARRLTALGRIARRLGAPWIAAASPAVLGLPTFENTRDTGSWTPVDDKEWRSLRSSPDARWLGLAAPRFLLRAPYGEDGEVVESFAFEEDAPGGPVFLWGNPAAACALLLAESFAADEWLMRLAGHNEIRELPLYLYRRDGETIAVPCAETLLTEDAVDALLELGLMPLITIRDADTIRLARFQSIASPVSPLAGPWAQRT